MLTLEGADTLGQLRGSLQVIEVDEPPTGELSAVRQIEILGKGVVLPSTRFLDRRPAPHASCTVEIEVPPGPISRRVLDGEVSIEEDRLNPGEQRAAPV